MKARLERILLSFGLIGPIYLALIIFILGSMFPGYNHINDFISELGAINSPIMGLANVSLFFFTGVFMVLFSIGLFSVFKGSKPGMAGSILIGLAGISFALLSAFPCDVSCFNFSITGYFHGVFSALTFMLSIPAFILFGIEAYHENVLDRKWVYIIATTIIFSGIFGFLYSEFGYGLVGLLQRVVVGIPILFILIISAYLLRKNKF